MNKDRQNDIRIMVCKHSGDTCLEWPYANNGMGYGTVKIAQKIHFVHRLSYRWYRGTIPDGMWVLHKCDNPKCFNPTHLFLGTAKDNNDDKCRKGRAKGGSQRGENNPNAKLNYEIVAEIRARRSQGERNVDIARSLGLRESVTSHVGTRRLWGHV